MSPTSNRPPAHHDDPNDAQARSRAFATFRARLEAGDYDALIGRKLRSSLRQAARETSLDPELGALRLAMVRLLREERDPTRLANSVSRLASVAVQIARLRPSAKDEFAEIRDQILREFDAMEAEAAAAASQQPDAYQLAPIPLPADHTLG